VGLWRCASMRAIIGGDAPFYALPYINQRGIPRPALPGQGRADDQRLRRGTTSTADGSASPSRASAAPADSFGDLPEEDSRWAGGVGRPLPSRADARPAEPA
jgi:hypothetical protein